MILRVLVVVSLLACHPESPPTPAKHPPPPKAALPSADVIEPVVAPVFAAASAAPPPAVRLAKPGGIFIRVGAFTSEGSATASVVPAVKEAIEAAFEKANIGTRWPTGDSPFKEELQAASVRAFAVTGNAAAPKETPDGPRINVECRVNLMLSSYPEGIVLSAVEAGTKLAVLNEPEKLRAARESCVVAVAETIATQRFVPSATKKK
jgi:hypothetical protein